MMSKESDIAKTVSKGFGEVKRKRPLQKYVDMGKAMFKFFLEVREAHGAVSRGLMESYMLSLPEDVRQEYFSITRSGQDEFWQRWRKFYGLTYRRFSGVKQYVPGDFETRLKVYKGLLRSMHQQHNFRIFVCGDETGSQTSLVNSYYTIIAL